MDIEKLNGKIAEHIKGIAELELEKQKRREAEKEAMLLDKKRKSVKLEAQELHGLDLRKRADIQRLKDEANTPEARTRESIRHAKEVRDRDISRGLTKEQRDYKYMDSKTRRECDNAIAQGEVRDIHGFLKKKRLKDEASERRRKKLKGL